MLLLERKEYFYYHLYILRLFLRLVYLFYIINPFDSVSSFVNLQIRQNIVHFDVTATISSARIIHFHNNIPYYF